MYFSQNNVVIKSIPLTAGASTTLTGAATDTLGYAGCCFVNLVGTLASTAVVTYKVQQASDDGVADAYNDLEGSALVVADDDDDQLFVIDIQAPAKRYLKQICSRTVAASSIGAGVAILYGAKSVPVTFDVTDNVTSEKFHTPAEGTA